MGVFSSVSNALERRRIERETKPLTDVAQSIGPGLNLRGRPTVNVHPGGRLEVGARFNLQSTPVGSHLEIGPNALVVIGDDVSIGHGAALASFAGLSIGDRCSLGAYAIIMDTDFHKLGAHTRELDYDATAIRIGKDVKIGARVTILRGTEIGDGVEILPASVVAGVVPAGAKIGGVPARVITASSSAESAADVATELPKVVATAFGLAAPPQLTDGRDQVAGWDSLGSLRLVLALEDAFSVSIDEEQMIKAKTVQHLVSAVEAAKNKRAQHT